MSPKDHSIKVRAQTSIKKGDEIAIQYLSFMFGHLRRKKTIQSYWFFTCACPRCQDPTELGLFFYRFMFIYTVSKENVDFSGTMRSMQKVYILLTHSVVIAQH